MVHDPEADAARYLGDDLPPAERARASRHLLSCADCWYEVEAGRRGRALLEAQRTVVPVDLRDRVRALVESEPPAARASRPAHGRRAHLVLAAAACLTGALAVGLATRTAEPAALRGAVQDYAAGQLPGADVTAGPAPDLSALRLQPVGAGGGTYAGLDVDGYAYVDPAGRRVVLLRSDRPFPQAPGAQRLAGSDGSWTADRGLVVVLGARGPHSLLVLGEDRGLVRSVAAALGVV